jgi:hypothetical protein
MRHQVRRHEHVHYRDSDCPVNTLFARGGRRLGICVCCDWKGAVSDDDLVRELESRGL